MDTVVVDQEWMGWLQGLLKSGADALGVDAVGEPVLGLRGCSIGCRVTTSGGWNPGAAHRLATTPPSSMAPA